MYERGTTVAGILALCAALFMVFYVVSWFTITYNNLNVMKRKTEKAFADIGNQLKRRRDQVIKSLPSFIGLLPKEFRQTLVETMIGRYKQEDLSGGIPINSMIGWGLSRFEENYPEEVNRISEAFHKFREEILGIEATIIAARNSYNVVVAEYNTLVTSMPECFVAQICGFNSIVMLQVDENDEEYIALDLNKIATGDIPLISDPYFKPQAQKSTSIV
ncbi:MAG: LemA family protein [Nanoarchaeota archaeon]